MALTDLSRDLVGVVFEDLSDVLDPRDAVSFSLMGKGQHEPTAAVQRPTLALTPSAPHPNPNGTATHTPATEHTPTPSPPRLLCVARSRHCHNFGTPTPTPSSCARASACTGAAGG